MLVALFTRNRCSRDGDYRNWGRRREIFKQTKLKGVKIPFVGMRGPASHPFANVAIKQKLAVRR